MPRLVVLEHLIVFGLLRRINSLLLFFNGFFVDLGKNTESFLQGENRFRDGTDDSR